MKKVEYILMKLPERFMKSTYKLIWSDEALFNLTDIVNYLERRWSKREIRKFAQLLDKQLLRIMGNPLMFAESDKSSGLRKSVLSSQTTIFYRIKNQEVHLIALFDNRQNPDKLRKM